jgi:hypothetical protein
MKLNELSPKQIHLYLKVRSFTGKIGEIVELKKYNQAVSSERDPDFYIVIKWQDGTTAVVTHEDQCECEVV